MLQANPYSSDAEPQLLVKCSSEHLLPSALADDRETVSINTRSESPSMLES